MTSSTRTMPKSRNWTWTLHAPTKEDLQHLRSLECVYLVTQLEKCPETGNVHLQGAIGWTNAIVRKGAKKRLFGRRTHVEIMRGSWKQNKTYCTKLESRVMGEEGFALEVGTMRKE